MRFWGVRGALASCSAETARYGANSACVEVEANGHTLILDAGSGLRLLGNDLLARGRTRAHLLFTHCHYDHISGLPFFAPFFAPDWRVDVWSGHLLEPLLPGYEDADAPRTRAMMDAYMRPPFFPVGPEVFNAAVRAHDFRPGDHWEIEGGVQVRTALLHHHDRAVAFRIDCGGRSFAYVTDTTHIAQVPDLTILALVHGADVMVYDATYTDAEFPRFWNFGHSTWEEGARIAMAADVGTYVPFHHRPSRTDDDLDRLEREARTVFPRTVFAREGARLEVAREGPAFQTAVPQSAAS